MPRPRLELADIFRAHGAAYRQQHALTAEQHTVMRAVEVCRTLALGGHVDVCTACGHERPAYNSCRNRHCPKCQGLAQARWIAQRSARLLPTSYFHVVFTLPAALRALAHRNRRRVFTLLFDAAAQTLLTLGRDPTRLGAQLGITAVLHTWTRALTFHPHLHCLVTGGGLALTGDHWVAAPRRHLFPVRVLSQLVRGKFLAALDRAYRAGELQFGGRCAALADPATFRRWRDQLYRQEWVVYAKPPFGGPQQVFQYLGRYTHRVGIANHRLQAMDAAGVRFATKHGATVTLPPAEFIRRFLLHVLPPAFVKIRHYGLLAARHATTTLAVARRTLEDLPLDDPVATAPTAAVHTDAGRPDWRTHFTQLTGIDLSRCPRCARGTMIAHPVGIPVRRALTRTPPAAAAA